MNEPDFLIVGAARCGSTALYHYLRQHPQIFLPTQKEPCYYCFAGEKPNYKNGKFAFAITESEQYKRLFNGAKPGQVKGEVSTPYLYLHDRTIKNIKKIHSHPDKIKILIILRNPIERAYSQYLWRVRDGREKLSFESALKEEKKRMEENYSFDYFYAHRGLYYKQVKNYLENFKHVKIVLFENFRNDFEKTMSGILDYLEVNPEFQFTRRSDVNRSSFPRFGAIGKLITVESKIKFKLLSYLPAETRLSIKEHFNRWNSSNKYPMPISASTKIYLQEYYKNDISSLATLTGLDLSSWMNS